MVADVAGMLANFDGRDRLTDSWRARASICSALRARSRRSPASISTCERYDRRRVDGLWMDDAMSTR